MAGLAPITQNPTIETKKFVIETIFESRSNTTRNGLFDRYFKYYVEELEMVQFRGITQMAPVTPLAVKTHADILVVIREIQTSCLLPKCKLRDKLRVHFPEAEDPELNASIDLALRLWLMLNIRDPRLKLQAPRTPILAWGETLPLRDFIDHTFPRSKCQIGVRDSRLHPSFTAAFMVEVCDLHLEWTDCLADHLRLDRRKRALRVYSYKECLQSALERRDRNEQAGVELLFSPFFWENLLLILLIRSGLPREVLVETIHSLNLLFPHWDATTDRLLGEHDQDFHRLGPYDGPPTLNLMEFNHWRDRLLELYDVVFQSPPVSWKQLWRDRRSPQQFWTFWIALVILVLTLISTIASIMQACASFRPPQC
jgi:hypothetical protein